MSPSVIDSIFVGLFGLVFMGACAAGLSYYQRSDPETKAFIRQQFDKLFIGALLMFSFFLLTHNLKYYLGQDSVINQTWGVVTFFLGMLSTLITGAISHRSTDQNGGSPNAPKRIDTQTITTATTHIEPDVSLPQSSSQGASPTSGTGIGGHL